jgi:MFS family permease
MIKKHINNRLPYLVWFLGATFFFIDYIVRVSPSVLTPVLMQFFNANAFTIGGFSVFFYYAYIGMQIPVGILVDRFSPKWLLIMSSLICVVSTLMFAEMQHIGIGFISRFLTGFGASFAFVGTLKLISIWFNAERFALLAGLTQTMGMVGAMVGQGPMAYVYKSLGWRTSMYGFSIVFIILSLLMFLFIKDNPDNLTQKHHNSKDDIKVIPSLKIIMTNTQT